MRAFFYFKRFKFLRFKKQGPGENQALLSLDGTDPRQSSAARYADR